MNIAESGDKCNEAGINGVITTKCAPGNNTCNISGSVCTVRQACQCGDTLKNVGDTCIVSVN